MEWFLSSSAVARRQSQDALVRPAADAGLTRTVATRCAGRRREPS